MEERLEVAWGIGGVRQRSGRGPKVGLVSHEGVIRRAAAHHVVRVGNNVLPTWKEPGESIPKALRRQKAPGTRDGVC